MANYFILEFLDWVNIVAVTKEKKLILIEQYRPPVDHVTLEVPGGSLDPKSLENTEEAAKRELLEETGYKAGTIKLLNFHYPNPALQTNKVWTYLAEDCIKIKNQELDEFEDIDVREVSIADAIKFSRDGTISHSLVLTSLHFAIPFLEKM
jgi:ADP-ribose pyrophosphatase